MSLHSQFVTLAMMVLSGIGMGAAYDGYRVVSHELRLGRLWIPILDLLYWMAATLIVFRVLMLSSEGEVRVYVFIGLLIGISFYFWLLSGTVTRLLGWSVEAVRWLIRLSMLIGDWLLIKPLKLLLRAAKLILSIAMVSSMFLLRIMVHLVRPFWLMLAWLFTPLVRPVWNRLMVWDAELGLSERRAVLAEKIRRIWKKWF